MKREYECAGGTVVRESEKKWSVFAPDGRLVDTLLTRRQALQRAEHWDKWDAFASLQDICLGVYPFLTLLMMGVLFSVKDGKVVVPTDEVVTKCVLLDVLHFLIYPLVTRGEVTKERYQECMREVAEGLMK